MRKLFNLILNISAVISLSTAEAQNTTDKADTIPADIQPFLAGVGDKKDITVEELLHLGKLECPVKAWQIIFFNLGNTDYSTGIYYHQRIPSDSLSAEQKKRIGSIPPGSAIFIDYILAKGPTGKMYWLKPRAYKVVKNASYSPKP